MAISTDSYHPGSIKAQERLRRGSPEIILAGSAVRQPYYTKSFHASYDAKNSYARYAVWCGKQAWLPGWTEQIWQSPLWRVVLLLHCLFPQCFVIIMPSVSIYQNTNGGAVPHIFVISLHHAIQSILLCDTGSGKHRQIVNWTSSFKSKGKLRPPKKLEKNTRCYETFRQIGDEVKCQASCDETAGAVCIRIWCTDTLVNLLWKPSMSTCPTRWCKTKRS